MERLTSFASVGLTFAVADPVPMSAFLQMAPSVCWICGAWAFVQTGGALELNLVPFGKFTTTLDAPLGCTTAGSFARREALIPVDVPALGLVKATSAVCVKSANATPANARTAPRPATAPMRGLRTDSPP